VAAAEAYRERIVAAAGPDFTPLMTCYLTDAADPAEIVRGFEAGVWVACKLYPAHATTNSAHGVTDVASIRPVLAAMQRAGMVLCVHGEVTDPAVDIFDRESAFIERVLTPLLRDFPALKVVLEHITTADAAAFVVDGPATLAATITPQHLHLNRNALFAGGLRPHHYCLPVLKREQHRLADKESACGCAGVWNAPFALESYAAVFEEEGALDRCEGFASAHGARFYGLPLNEGTVTLVREPVEVPARIGELVPFHAGERLAWRMRD
jgi:dihydroorotase